MERREALEKWFQKIAQDAAITNSIEFRDFLLNQQDEVKLCCEEVDITVCRKVSWIHFAFNWVLWDACLAVACRLLVADAHSG